MLNKVQEMQQSLHHLVSTLTACTVWVTRRTTAEQAAMLYFHFYFYLSNGIRVSYILTQDFIVK